MKYLLIVFLSGLQPSQLGPFENLLSCEKAATQARFAHKELRAFGTFSYVCVSTKSPDFKFKDPYQK